MKDRYLVLDHTADLRIEIRGSDLPSLFANAGYALFDLLTDVRKVNDSEADEVSVEGGDAEDLLVRWMGELLFRYDARGRLCRRFDRPVIEGGTVIGRTWGETFDPARHRARREIKAVTYHGISVTNDSGEWVARVLLDV